MPVFGGGTAMRIGSVSRISADTITSGAGRRGTKGVGKSGASVPISTTFLDDAAHWLMLDLWELSRDDVTARRDKNG